MAERPEEYLQSSYGTYVTASSEEIVRTEMILGQLTGNKATAKEHYKTYVESVLGEEIDSPMKKVYGGMMLGRERFIRGILSRMASEQVEGVEISHRKALRAGVGVEEIISAVCEYYGVTIEEIAGNRRSQARNTGIYLLKKHTGTTNAEIGELFGGLSYSAVAKIYQNFSQKLAGDRELRCLIENIQKKISIFKG